jgi:hypothetical protein
MKNYFKEVVFFLISITFASLLQWPRSLMDRASDYGSEGCRFESYRGHKEVVTGFVAASFFIA